MPASLGSTLQPEPSVENARLTPASPFLKMPPRLCKDRSPAGLRGPEIRLWLHSMASTRGPACLLCSIHMQLLHPLTLSPPPAGPVQPSLRTFFSSLGPQSTRFPSNPRPSLHQETEYLLSAACQLHEDNTTSLFAHHQCEGQGRGSCTC